MVENRRGEVSVAQCGSCGGIFLDAAERGVLAEQENDWHTSRGPQTQPLPRITPDMEAPPAGSPPRRARSFVDGLFD